MKKRTDPVCSKHTELGGVRYKDGHCVGCSKQAKTRWYKKNKEMALAKSAAYYAERGKYLAKLRAEQNATRIRTVRAAYRELHREDASRRTKEWRRKNYPQARAHEKQNWALRYSLIGGQAIAKKYAKQTRAIYLACPEGHEVDHIIPLRGKGVNGLHVPWNLQYLPAKENRSKGNRIEENV